MPDITDINCEADISNLFTRGQHELSKAFEFIEGIDGNWTGMIPDAGRFPVGSGFAARVTTLGQQRLNFQSLNLWKDMVGLQTDCAVSCDPPTTTLEFANADHKWYRLMHVAYNTKPYCLTSMFADALNLPEQIAQIYRDLKHVTMDVMDEFYRNNQVGLSKYRWMGYDSGAAQNLLSDGWRFATDANGNIDTSYIILDDTVNPNNIALLSTDILNLIRNRGIPIRTFSKDAPIPLVTDYQTFQALPLYDTNRRADNRFRAPAVLNPSYAETLEYAGYTLRNDYFALRYYWTTTEPGYPNGVLKRVDQWSSQEFSEGCWSAVSDAYENADFQIAIPWGQAAFEMQNGEQPLSAGSGVNFQASASPWDGTWRWINEVNEVTPCNQDRNKGYWRMVLKKAARPKESGIRGHVLLHRRFPDRGIVRSCATLKTLVAGSPDCTLTCPPLDHYPPALVDIFSCGGWNAEGTCGAGN
jgi:hypothetical protein